MAFDRTIPIVKILDETKAREFYIEFLGFRVDWEARSEGPLYMQISKDECVLQLTEHDGDCNLGVAIQIVETEIDKYVQELNSKDYEYPKLRTIEQPWGSNDMVLIDPFGNRLVLTDEFRPS